MPSPRPATARALDGRTGPVAIIGGGIGGLATALALAQRGIASQVLERRPAFAEDGAGIQLGPNAVHVLTRLGAADRLAETVGVPEAIRVHAGASDAVLARLPLGAWIAQRHGAPYWVAHRHDMHAALLALARADPLISILTSTPVTAVEPRGDGAQLRTGDGRTLTAACVVAADGLWSPIRQQGFSPTPPRFAGKAAFRAVLPAAQAPGAARARDTFVWMRPQGHVVHYPVRGGRDIAIVGIFAASASAADWSAPADTAAVNAHVSGFPGPVRQLFAAVPEWRMWALHDLPRLPWPAQGPTALLGDAAHPMMPFLAQGGAMALEDAVVLADCLAQRPTIADAWQSYARLRHPRTSRVEAGARRNGRIYHLSGLAAAARNLTLGTIPGTRIMAGYDWLYGWRPPTA